MSSFSAADRAMATLNLWYADGVDAPRISPADALNAAGARGRDARVTLGWTIERHPWIDEPAFRARTVLAGYGLGRAVNEGRVTALPVRLSAVPSMIEDDPPDVAVVTGVRRGDRLAFGSSVGWADVLARHASALVVEVDDDGTDLGAPLIEGDVVATVRRPPAPTTSPAASRPADDTDLRIGALVASLLPDDPTLQFGPGGIGEGIARSLDRPVTIRSGLVTDAMAEIHERGLLLAPVVAAYAWGGEPIRRLADAGMLRLTSCTETHDLSSLSSTPRLVGCNTALQVGLDGSVNVERIGGRIIAAVGGHSDFCAGASRSPGGLSIIAVRSLTASGESTIVHTVDQVSTQRSDIDLLVTEHGVADLRGIGDRDRAERIIEVAAPEHRDALRAAADGR
jgi:acyl-CoA hydrolase